ncbi:MAG: DNA-directed RNA polymerase subunit alpha [Planctomycetota bacterium]
MIHKNWQDLIKPTGLNFSAGHDEHRIATAVAEPLERGFGLTLGNALRRVLLSSLQGAAVTAVQIDGVLHEFSSVAGVREDVTDIVLNLKGLAVKMEGEGPKRLQLSATGPGPVTASDIAPVAGVEIINREHVICHLDEGAAVHMEITVDTGKGYVAADRNRPEDAPIGLIPVDAIYSPVQRVRYKIEETRVGQKTNYDKLLLEIWTNGTLTPEMALVEAAKIVRKHLNPFVQYLELGEQRVSEEAAAAAGVDEELIRKLDMPLADLDLSVRASNCLESARIDTVAQLVQYNDAELLKLRAFGRTSLREVKRKLLDLQLELGMQLPEGYQVGATAVTQ